MRRNLNAGLPGRTRSRCSMRAYDALPPALRRWLAGACLPWSPESALRIWRRARAETGSDAAAAARCAEVEAAMLARERVRAGSDRPNLYAALR
jgi:Family of unknown function (DUF6525)